MLRIIKKIFNKVVKTAKRMTNDLFIESAENRSQAVWRVMYNELGFKNHTNSLILN